MARLRWVSAVTVVSRHEQTEQAPLANPQYTSTCMEPIGSMRRRILGYRRSGGLAVYGLAGEVLFVVGDRVEDDLVTVGTGPLLESLVQELAPE